jgi:subtilisin family serine protease
MLPTNQTEANLMGVKSGTSMATPFVSGVAALLYATKSTLTAVDVATAINSTVTVGNGFGVRTHGKVNALAAVQAVK